MQKNEMWLVHKINSESFQQFIFKVNDNQDGFKILFNSTVHGNGLDIEFTLCTYKDCQKLLKWMKNKMKFKYDSHGQIVKDKSGYPISVAVPRPKIREFFGVKANILNRATSLPSGTYVLLFDNTYSIVRGKDLLTHIVETWNEKNIRNFPGLQYLLKKMPSDVAACINDANDSYVAGHHDQCSVMLRKGIELAVRIKLLQSGLSSQLLDDAGNEIGLSAKIKLLRTKRLLTQKSASDIEQIKWFGDMGAHGTMKIEEQDIRDNIGPKVRSFLAALNLKA